MCDVECLYKEKCTGYPGWCGSCINNKGKRNYYKPDPYPYYQPWITSITIPMGGTMTGYNYYSGSSANCVT
jgi:hypothetical protein